MIVVINMLKRFLLLSLYLTALLLLASCVVEPVTGRRQLIVGSVEEEMEQSALLWTETLKKHKPSKYSDLKWLVDKVQTTLLSNGDFGHKWTFMLLSSDEPNAFSLPGGQVAVYDALFKHIDNEAELAAVIAHEMAHVIARHSAERSTERYVVDMGRSALSAALEQARAEKKDIIMAAYSGIFNVGFLMPDSRQHEYSADRIAMVMMAQAGYDPQCAIDFWERFAKTGRTGFPSDFLASHPSDAARARALKAILPEANNIYRVSHKIGKGVLLQH